MNFSAKSRSYREHGRPWGGKEPTKRKMEQKEKAASGSALSPCLAAAVLAALGGLSVHSTSCCLEARPPGVKGRLGTGRLVWDREMGGLENWGGAGLGGMAESSGTSGLGRDTCGARRRETGRLQAIKAIRKMERTSISWYIYECQYRRTTLCST